MRRVFEAIKVTEGNAFSIVVPLKKRTFVSERPIDEDIDVFALENLHVFFGSVEYTPILTTGGVCINLPATLQVRSYSLLLTATYQGAGVRVAYETAVIIVPYSEQSDAQNYLPGSPIVLGAAYIIGGAMTDEELEQLKEEMREKNAQLAQAIEDAEAAKAEWERKAAELDDVAQQTTLVQGVQTLSNKIDNINIDTSDLAKQGTNPNANISAIQALIGYSIGEIDGI